MEEHAGHVAAVDRVDDEQDVEDEQRHVVAARVLHDQQRHEPAHALHATKAWLNRIDRHASPASRDAALAASISLVGSPEERERLEQLWAKN